LDAVRPGARAVERGLDLSAAGGAARSDDDPPSTSAEALHTGEFSMSMESLALQGLRELAASLAPGTSIESQGDVARLITRLHDTVLVASRAYVAVRGGYRRFVSRLGLDASRLLAPGRAALEATERPEAVAAGLVEIRANAALSPADLEAGFDELRVHQVALLDGLLEGLTALLDELSPQALERELEGRRGSPFGSSHRRLWEAYRARHTGLTERGEALSRLFGEEFSEAYRAYRRRRL
jgi:hypothetical protein